jgi:hypothetical protein
MQVNEFYGEFLIELIIESIYKFNPKELSELIILLLNT